MTTLLLNLKKASLSALAALLFGPAVSDQTSLQPNRDETRPVAVSIPMGEGPVIRAGVEILQMQRYHEDPAEAKYDRILREAAE